MSFDAWIIYLSCVKNKMGGVEVWSQSPSIKKDVQSKSGRGQIANRETIRSGTRHCYIGVEETGKRQPPKVEVTGRR